MFNIFKKKEDEEEKCSVCKMGLEKGKDYPTEGDKKFCSDSCKSKHNEQSSSEISG